MSRPFIRGISVAGRILPGLVLALTPLAHGVPPSWSGTEPDAVPVPLVEREEVRFVSIDVVIERREGESWTRARDITRDQIDLRVAGRTVELDSFENWCAGGRDDGQGSTIAATGPAAGTETPSSRAPAGGKGPGAADVVPRNYILYFDLEQLKLSSRNAALQAAREWARGGTAPADRVMIVTAGHTLRILRSLLPASQGLEEDLEKVKRDFRVSEMWADGEAGRVEEIDKSERSGFGGSGTLASIYTRIDYQKAATSLREMSDLMAILGTIEGPKSLLVFEDTLRMLPGREYGAQPHLSDVQVPLQALADAANDRQVRIYPVHLGLDDRADDALTLLATETGGQYLEGTNRAATIFERVSEDLSCFYRLGFRIRPGSLPGDARIEVRVREDGRACRTRARRSLGLPSREERAEGLVRAALLVPSSARAFPVRLAATTIFRHARGARVRLQIEIESADLLGLPAPGHPAGTRALDVEIGGQVVPLLARVGGESLRRNLDDLAFWSDADSRKTPWIFGRLTRLTLPAAAAGRPPARRVVQVEDIDAGPGSFRVVAVVHDQLAGTVAAAVADLQVEIPPPLLGEIHLFENDPDAAVVRDGPLPPGGKTPPSIRKGEVGPVSSPLEIGGIEPRSGSVRKGNPVTLIYSVCRPDLTGSQLIRTLACAGSGHAPPLPAPVIARTEAEGGCVVVIDRPALGGVNSGSCRFEVGVEGPDGGRASRALSFGVVP